MREWWSGKSLMVDTSKSCHQLQKTHGKGFVATVPTNGRILKKQNLRAEGIRGAYTQVAGMVQWVRLPVLLDDLNLILRLQMVEGEKQLPQVVL